MPTYDNLDGPLADLNRSSGISEQSGNFNGANRLNHSRFNASEQKQVQGNGLFYSTLFVCFVLVLGSAGCCVVEQLKVGDTSKTDKFDAKGSAAVTSLGATILQFMAFVIAVLGHCLKSGSAFIVATILSAMTMTVATATFVGEIADANTQATNTRYLAFILVYFVLGFVSISLLFMSTIRMEMVRLMPTVFTEVDAQAANLLNILMPPE